MFLTALVAILYTLTIAAKIVKAAAIVSVRHGASRDGLAFGRESTLEFAVHVPGEPDSP